MSWQRCPVCNCNGQECIIDGFGSFSKAAYKTCSVCFGKRIINTETGLPPVDAKPPEDVMERPSKDNKYVGDVTCKEGGTGSGPLENVITEYYPPDKPKPRVIGWVNVFKQRDGSMATGWYVFKTKRHARINATRDCLGQIYIDSEIEN